MSLQFVFGNSGSGKSEYLYNRILEEARENPDVDYLLIVPEQFTMQTQRELVLRQEKNAIMNIDVLSFQRMAFRVFDELGKNDVTILEETGKNLVLRKVAQEKLEELKTLKGNMKKIGYISEIKSLLSELTQYNIGPKDIEMILQNSKENEPFQMKMRDIELMYRGFQEYLKDRYITAEEVLELLSDLADKSEMLKNSVLILDGFTGFTPLQNNLLRKLFKISREILVSLCMDTRTDFYTKPVLQDLFYMSKKTVQQLIQIAEETNTTMEEPVILEGGETKRYRESEALFFLEQNLFRRRSRRYQKKTEDIKIYSLRNPRQELEFAAKQICQLVREHNYRYRDVAIVSGDIENYGNYAADIFEKYEIPIFLDTKKNILYHPFIECIRSVLEIMEQDFSYESIFRFLKTGLAGVTYQECDYLENYILALGIRGQKRWEEKWVKVPYRWEEKDVEKPEEIRCRIMEYLSPFAACYKEKNANTRQQTKALYQLLVNLKVEQQLKQYQEEFEAKGDLASAKEYEQIYGIVMDLFDKVVDLLGEEVLNVREYREILDAGFEAAKVGVIPPGNDRVVIGDIERTRLDHIKILFFIGVNDGIIPKAEISGGIISQMERERLAQQNIELAPTGRERVFIQKFYLYLNMTKPSCGLYLTFSQVNSQGKSLRKSYLVGTLLKLFPEISIQEEQEDLGEIITANSSLSYYIRGLQDTEQAVTDEIFKALHQWYQNHLEWSEKIMRLSDAAFFYHKREMLTRETARALYGTVLENSVTRLERFASCAYAHFLTYGLQLAERQLCEFAPVDMGNVFHGTLETYSKELAKSGYTWFNVEEEKSQEILRNAFEQAVAQYHGEALFDNARDSYMVHRMERMINRTVWALKRQVRSGVFKPESYEVSFAFAEDLDAVNFKLSEEEKMRLRGRIDRVDTYETKEKLYVKIIDYKSGNTQFQLLSMYHGMQLQLVVYLNAAMELMKKKYPDKEVAPAGIFYYHIDDPVIDEKKPMPEEEIWKEILTKLKLDGLVNEKEEVYRAMDQEFSGSSNVIPVGVNKDGSLSKTSKAASEENFQEISKFVNRKISQLGQRIVQGDIDVSPYCLDNADGCSYCPYTGICGFDEKLPGFSKRRLEKIDSRDQIIEKMKEEVQDGHSVE